MQDWRCRAHVDPAPAPRTETDCHAGAACPCLLRGGGTGHSLLAENKSRPEEAHAQQPDRGSTHRRDDRRRDPQRRCQPGAGRGHHRRHPQGAARSLRDLLPRPEARCRAPQGLHAPLRQDLHPPQLQGHAGRCRDHHDHARARRQEDRRRGLACRHDHDARAADGRHPLRRRGAALRRRHAVCQPGSGLRGAVGGHEEDARGREGDPFGPQGRGPCRQQERASAPPRCARTPTGARP